jgi:type I restriction enzyme S subunit
MMSDLPDGWMKLPLGEVNEFSSNTINPASHPDELFELYSVPSFPTGKPERLLGSEIGSTKQTVTTDDVLISKINPRINRVWTVGPKATEEQIASSEWIGFRTSVVQPAFANYYFRSQEFRDLLCSEVAGVGGSLTRAQPKRVAAYLLPIAPLNEQTRIADQLDTLLARVNNCNDRLDAIPGILKRFRKAVLRCAVTGQLSRDWRESQPQAVSQWAVVCIKDVGRVQLGRQRAPKFHAGKNMRPYLRVQNVFEARLDLSDVMEMDFPPADFERYQLYPGDILLNEGQSPEYLGRPAMYRGELPGACFTNTLIRFQAGPSVLPEFALTVFRHHMHSGRYVQEGKITTNLAHLGAGRFADVEFPLPSLDEQREIVRRTEELFGLVDRIEARYTRMRAHAQRLVPQVLAKAFRGELVQQDPQDEPASVLLQRLAASQPVKAPTSRGRPRTQPPVQPDPPALKPSDWATLPSGEWSAPADPQGQATTVCLTAVLMAWGQPMPERDARLATLLCQQPRLFTTVLPAAQAKQWSRLVGNDAKPLPAKVARIQPAANHHWGQAIKRMRASGDLVESGSGDNATWALGSGAVGTTTTGWPDGRAAFVVAHLRAHGIASVLPALEPAAQEFVNVRAA